jgi:hypothetical protein
MRPPSQRGSAHSAASDSNAATNELDRSGWWLLLGAVPVAGQLVMAIWLGLFEGTAQSNKYGPVPKAWWCQGSSAPRDSFDDPPQTSE